MSSRTRLSIPLLMLAVFPFAAQGQTHECREVMVKMRDGVELATDLYLPTAHGPGPFPVVLTRTPYGKGDCDDTSAKYFAKHGYAAVSQDERGRYRSRGVYYWLRDNAWHERRDGYDTIEWAGSQPWSNGKVGTMGSSFTCANQLLTAPTKPPHLVAMFCGEFASNPYRDVYYAGGALHMIMPTWLLTQAEMVKPLPENVPGQRGYLGSGESWNEWYERRQESGGSFDQNMFSRMYQDLLGNPYYNDYW
ncbi:MAG TPA: CocE/NonD family hydrolase, partial [Vicinamibacteria bacterium]|nr:CocE/NonD family hydrolase [Vicinamibacteria bacterium]